MAIGNRDASFNYNLVISHTKKTLFPLISKPDRFLKSVGFIVCANLIRMIINSNLFDISNK